MEIVLHWNGGSYVVLYSHDLGEDVAQCHKQYGLPVKVIVRDKKEAKQHLHNSPVGFASDAVTLIGHALALIEEMKRENPDYTVEQLAALTKDEIRFLKAKELMLQVLRD